eukprot:1158596-Pelagomonas_calceolata.AAC.2
MNWCRNIVNSPLLMHRHRDRLLEIQRGNRTGMGFTCKGTSKQNWTRIKPDTCLVAGARKRYTNRGAEAQAGKGTQAHLAAGALGGAQAGKGAQAHLVAGACEGGRRAGRQCWADFRACAAGMNVLS